METGTSGFTCSDLRRAAQARRDAREDSMAEIVHLRLRNWVRARDWWNGDEIAENGWQHRGGVFSAMCRVRGWSLKAEVRTAPGGVGAGPMEVFAWSFCRDCGGWSWHRVTRDSDFQRLSRGRPCCERCAFLAAEHPF